MGKARLLVKVVLSGLAAAGLATVSVGAAGAVAAPTSVQVVDKTGPWTTPIPTNPRLDVRSAHWADMLGARNGYTDSLWYANEKNFSMPVYAAQPTDTAYDFTVTSQSPNPFARFNPLRVPRTAAPSPGDDSWLTVVDAQRGIVYELWQAHFTGGRWVGSQGGVFKLPYDGATNPLSGWGVGAGFAAGAGAITPEEMRAAVNGDVHAIHHALFMSTKYIQSNAHRYPAVKDEGERWGTDAIPEGARVQLDPSLPVPSSLPPAKKAIFLALQTYGAYVGDTGDHAGAITFQGQALDDPSRNPPYNMGDNTRAGGVYAQAFDATGDYQALTGIPWQHLRVLAAWNGA